MSELPTPNAPARRLRRIIFIVTVGIFLLGVVLYAYMQGGFKKYGPFPPTEADIIQLVNTNTETEEYRKGAEYLETLAEPDTPPSFYNDNDQVQVAIRDRLVIDFLRTLTPGQVKLLELEDKLPFTKLDSNQQQILRRLPEYKQLDTGFGPNDSYIVLHIFRTTTPYANFEWYDPHLKDPEGKTAAYVMHHYFLRNAL